MGGVTTRWRTMDMYWSGCFTEPSNASVYPAEGKAHTGGLFVPSRTTNFFLIIHRRRSFELPNALFRISTYCCPPNDVDPERGSCIPSRTWSPFHFGQTARFLLGFELNGNLNCCSMILRRLSRIKYRWISIFKYSLDWVASQLKLHYDLSNLDWNCLLFSINARLQSGC